MRPTHSLLIVAALVTVLACASTPKSRSNDHKPGDPLESLALMRQGSISFQQERFDNALRLFKEAAALTPTNGTIHNMIGLCFMRLEEPAAAIEAFNEALRLIPAFTDARNNRGAVYLALNQFQLAQVDFIAVLADTTYPHHYEAYYNLGLANLGQGQLGAALENFQRAINAPSPVFAAYLRLAEIKQQQGDTKAAIDLLDEAILKFPERLEASLAMGRLLTTLGRTDDAKPYLDKIIQAYPGSPIAEEAAQLLGTK